jgi:hypothetical protein
MSALKWMVFAAPPSCKTPLIFSIAQAGVPGAGARAGLRLRARRT